MEKRQIKWIHILMKCNGKGEDMEWRKWVNNDDIKWIWKWSGIEM